MRLFSAVQMEWSQPQPQGVLPTPRAGHAAVTIGDSWFIIGGGDNKSGKFPVNSYSDFIYTPFIRENNMEYHHAVACQQIFLI